MIYPQIHADSADGNTMASSFRAFRVFRGRSFFFIRVYLCPSVVRLIFLFYPQIHADSADGRRFFRILRMDLDTLDTLAHSISPYFPHTPAIYPENSVILANPASDYSSVLSAFIVHCAKIH